MIRWGIIGPGSIARVFCNGLRFSQTGTAVAVASRDKQKATQFADLFSIDTVHASYDALLADDGVDAWYKSLDAWNGVHLESCLRKSCELLHPIGPVRTLTVNQVVHLLFQV